MTQLLAKARKSVALFTLISFSSAILAQQPAPERQPGGNQDEDIIRISTNLAQIDLVVLDAQGHFVEGLRPEQFQLLVDGKPQDISFFEQVKAGSDQEIQLATARLNQRSNQKPNQEKVLPSTPSTISRGRTTLLFIDDLHLSPASIKRTQDLLLNYVDNLMSPKDQAVIATASGQLGFLQQAIGDRGVLRRAIERLTYHPSSSADTVASPAMNEYQAVAIENGDRETLSYFVDKQCDEFKQMGRGACRADTGMTNNGVYDNASSGSSDSTREGQNIRAEADRMVRSRARIIARQTAQVALSTLGSLESLIRSVSQFPERKLVVFISDGFFINYLRSTNAYDLHRIADIALRAGAVIYTIDARGLVAGSADASSKDRFDRQGRNAHLAISEVSASQDPLNSLASDTGGRAWLNSNNLAQGLGQALSETSAYYLLAWQPKNAGEKKTGFSNIEVKIKDRPDLTVRTHAGFLDTVATADKKADDPTTRTKAKTVEDQLLEVIRAPYPRRSLSTELSVGYMSLNNSPAVAASMLIDAAALGADAKAGEVDVMGIVANEKGTVVSSVQQHLTTAGSQRGRLIYTIQFPNLLPGLYQVRVAARDPKSGRAGSASRWLEVPDTSKGDLTLSSVFLSEVPVGTPSMQKVSINPDRRFARTSRMRLQAQIFNALHASGAPDLTLELQLSTGGRVVIATPPTPVSTQGIPDVSRVPLIAEFPLEGFQPGRYLLKITITDRAAKKTATQELEFSVE